MQLNMKNINNSIKKNGQKNRYFSKEDIQMTNRHMKRCSTSPIIRKMQIKTAMRYYITPIRMVVIKKTKKLRNVGEDVEKSEP